MKQLGKKRIQTYETVEAFACICSCYCSSCSCRPILATNNYYSLQNSTNSSRTSSRTA